jgi:hypothetical protein
MRHSTAAVARVLSALLGLGLLLAGGSIILWRCHVGFARTLYAHADRHWYLTAGQQPWWSWALAVITIVGLVGGLVLLTVTLRPNRLGTVELARSVEPLGTSTLGAGTFADAVAAELARHELVYSARGRAVIDRGLPTLRITVTAPVEVPLDQLRGLAAAARADVASAIGAAAPAMQFFVEYRPERR